MDNLLIDQPAGIGDILFIQKIVKILGLSYNVYLPLKDSIKWLENYIPGLNNLVPSDHAETLILDGASNCYPNKRIMESKYLKAGIPFDDYINYVNINRNLRKEKELYRDKVKSSKYRLICPYFGTPNNNNGSGCFKIDIPKSEILDNVIINFDSNYNIFDWISIITDATEIYTTDSCIMFLIEKYKCNAKKLVAYSRRSSTKEIDYLFTKNWEYVC